MKQIKIGYMALSKASWMTPRIEGIVTETIANLETLPCQLVSCGKPVTTESEIIETCGLFKREGVDAVVMHFVTFPAGAMIPAAGSRLDVPIILLANPEKAGPGKMWEQNSFCGANMAAHGLNRLRKSYSYTFALPGETAAKLAVPLAAVRARKALFDSIGSRLAGSVVLDLCAGSGALALEAASRGAAAATLVEADQRHIRVIEENVARVKKAGVACDFRLINGRAEAVTAYAGLCGKPDVIFADPPYAESAALFGKLLADGNFTAFAAGALLVWEIPDSPGSVGAFLQAEKLARRQIRKFGGTDFLLGEIAP